MRPPVHPLFEAALAAMHPNYARKAKPHLGGPAPIVPRRGQGELVIRCATVVSPLVEPDRSHLYTRAIEAIHARHREPTDDRLEEAREAVAALGVRIPATDPISMVGVAMSAVEHLVSGLRNTPRAARVAVVRTVRLLSGPRDGLAGTAHQLPSPSKFLDALDERLLRLELAFGIGRRSKDGDARVKRILYRGADTTGASSVWVVELTDGLGALVRREGFHWAEGDRGFVLATVPDEHFEAATDAVFSASS